MPAPEEISDLLAPPNPANPDPRFAAPTRRARRRGKGFVAAVVASALVLVSVSGAMAYFGFRIALNENIERVEDPFADLDPSTRPAPAAP